MGADRVYRETCVKLDELVSRGSAGSRLPSAAALARRFGVSHVTILKALRELRRRGLVVVRPGSGAFVAGEVVPSPVPDADEAASPPQGRSAQVVQALRRDILSGALAADRPLPPSKALTNRYGVADKTMRKAVACLVEQGYLELRDGGYAVSVPRSSASRPAVLYVFTARRGASLENMPPRSLELLRELERSASLSGLELLPVPCDQGADGGLVPFRSDGIPAPGTSPARRLLGAILWTIGSSPHGAAGMLARLEALGTPVAVLDELGYGRRLRAASRRTAVFPLACTDVAGRVVGRHALRLGHRSIAYLGGGPADWAWSRVRLAGLRAAVEEAGVTVKLTEYPIATEDKGPAFPLPFHSMVSSGLDSRQRRTLLDALETYRNYIQNSYAQHWNSAGLEAYLNRVLHEGDATLWVAQSDIVGLAALQLLRDRTSHRIALVSFDDTPGSAFAGLASYNFNVHGVTQLMLEHVLRSGPHTTRDRRYRSELEGYVNVRPSLFGLSLPPSMHSSTNRVER